MKRVLICAIFWFSAGAGATTIDFQELEYEFTSTVDTQGYTLETATYFFVLGLDVLVPGDYTMGLPSATDDLRLTHQLGESFSIASLDAFTQSPTDTLNVTGYLEGGGELYTSFAIAGGSIVNTYSFSSAWQNLSAVQFDSVGDLNIDNIVVATVPVPAAVWLFGSALAGLGWIRRKQTV